MREPIPCGQTGGPPAPSPWTVQYTFPLLHLSIQGHRVQARSQMTYVDLPSAGQITRKSKSDISGPTDLLANFSVKSEYRLFTRSLERARIARNPASSPRIDSLKLQLPPSASAKPSSRQSSTIELRLYPQRQYFPKCPPFRLKSSLGAGYTPHLKNRSTAEMAHADLWLIGSTANSSFWWSSKV